MNLLPALFRSRAPRVADAPHPPPPCPPVSPGPDFDQLARVMANAGDAVMCRQGGVAEGEAYLRQIAGLPGTQAAEVAATVLRVPVQSQLCAFSTALRMLQYGVRVPMPLFLASVGESCLRDGKSSPEVRAAIQLPLMEQIATHGEDSLRATVAHIALAAPEAVRPWVLDGAMKALASPYVETDLGETLTTASQYAVEHANLAHCAPSLGAQVASYLLQEAQRHVGTHLPTLKGSIVWAG
ncbi:MAG: hypothetical protein ACYCW6_12910 [Candidatus Xenobia bacterium]